MDKTVENIKKFLHISPKKKKGAKQVEGLNGEAVVEEKSVTTKVEVTRKIEDEIEVDDIDADYEGDRCESCK